MAPHQYTFSTTIQIGDTLVSNGTGTVLRAIEPPEVVMAKIKESYIPFAVNKMMNDREKISLDVQVRNPKGSNLIILSSKGPLSMSESYKDLHNLVVKPILEDHLKIIDVPRRSFLISSQQANIKLKNLEDPRIYSVEEKDLLIQIEAAKMKLTGLEEQEKLLLSQKMRLTETQALLRKQILAIEE